MPRDPARAETERTDRRSERKNGSGIPAAAYRLQGARAWQCAVRARATSGLVQAGVGRIVMFLAPFSYASFLADSYPMLRW